MDRQIGGYIAKQRYTDTRANQYIIFRIFSHYVHAVYVLVYSPHASP